MDVSFLLRSVVWCLWLCKRENFCVLAHVFVWFVYSCGHSYYIPVWVVQGAEMCRVDKREGDRGS